MLIAWYSHWYRRRCWGTGQNPLTLISTHQRILIATPVPLNAGFVLAGKAHVASKQDSPEVPESVSLETAPCGDGRDLADECLSFLSVHWDM